MKITEHIHALKIPFEIPVAPGKVIERVVYSYIILGDRITLIDSGVSGSDEMILSFIKKIGRDPKEISLLILSHSHPDHIGSAKAIKDATGCTIAAHAGEKNWIEDVELQFRERPVPGFYTLVGGPVRVDRLLAEGEPLALGESIGCQVLYTPGHSKGSVSLIFGSEKAIFTGDAVPLPNDLPIYDNITDCVVSLRMLKEKTVDIDIMLSSWEAPLQGKDRIRERIDDGISYLRRIHETVIRKKGMDEKDLMELCRQVVKEMGLPPFAANPLVARAFASSLEAGADSFFEI